MAAVSGYCVGRRILWCSLSGDQPENNLAKLGYILDVKVKPKKKKKNKKPSTFLATHWNLL